MVDGFNVLVSIQSTVFQVAIRTDRGHSSELMNLPAYLISLSSDDNTTVHAGFAFGVIVEAFLNFPLFSPNISTIKVVCSGQVVIKAVGGIMSQKSQADLLLLIPLVSTVK